MHVSLYSVVFPILTNWARCVPRLGLSVNLGGKFDTFLSYERTAIGKTVESSQPSPDPGPETVIVCAGEKNGFERLDDFTG